jgi:hypothetical protein
MHRALLMHDLDEGDFRSLFEEGVEQRPDAMSRHARHIFDAIFLERARYDLSAGELHL